MESKKLLHLVAVVLVWVGALNWGLVGLLGMNLVANLLGGWPMVERAVYVLVGLGAVYEIVMHKMQCRMCSEK